MYGVRYHSTRIFFALIITAALAFPAAVAAQCPDATPTLIAPGEGSTVQAPVLFEWTSVDRAIGYSVVVRGIDREFVIANTDAGTTTFQARPVI